jgi:hypothetical protein
MIVIHSFVLFYTASMVYPRTPFTKMTIRSRNGLARAWWDIVRSPLIAR